MRKGRRMKIFNLFLVLLISGLMTVSCVGTKATTVGEAPIPQEVIIKVESSDPVDVDVDVSNPEAEIWAHGLNNESGGILSYITYITPESVIMNLYSGISVNDFVKLSSDLSKLKDFTDYRVIDLNINSPGGSAFDGLSISDLIIKYQAQGFTFRGHAAGIVASAAVPIFAVCNERYATEGAIFMVHEAALWKWPGRETASDIKTQSFMMDLLRDQYTSYLVNNSKLSTNKWNELQTKTTWFTTTQAKDFGLVDFIE